MRERSSEPRTIRVRVALLSAIAFAFALSCCVFAQETAAVKPELERVKRQLAEAQERVVNAYIAEQPSGPRRADVLLIIATFYEIGRFGDPNPALAAKYYRQAAEMGSADALCALGHVYATGVETDAERVPRDPEKARSFFQRAVDAGSVRAMVELGMIYADGKDVEPDSKKALDYFVEAAKRADPTALDRLEPVMRKAREWEEAKPGRKGKAGFPTSKEEIIDTALVDAFVDDAFNKQMLASEIYVEVSRRFMVATKNMMK